jgi:hypothetical protein
MFNEKLIESVKFNRGVDKYTIKIVYAPFYKNVCWQDTLMVEVNPITAAALEYLEALRVDSRSNCSELPYEEEVTRVINTLKAYDTTIN